MFKKIFIIFTIVSSLIHASRDNFIIAIDIGHTEKNQGATSCRGIGEYIYNKNIGNILLKLLKESGYTKSFIIEKNGKLTLKDRTKIAKEQNATIFLSIHHDSVQKKYLSSWLYKGKKNYYSNKFTGYSIFISNKNIEKNKSILLANEIGKSLHKNQFKRTLHHNENIKGENRKILNFKTGVYEFNDLIVLKYSKIPSVLIECGIIVNKIEEKNLSNSKYQYRLVNSIIEGINNYSQTKN